MRRLLLVTLACFLLTSFSLHGQTDTVTILHLNDTHSNLAPIGPRNAALGGSLGGIARAVTLIGMEKMADPKALLLHAGDLSIGDLFYNKYFGVAELQILASIGCDAMAVGNHEFDLTPSTLLTALDSGFVAGRFPLLCANIDLQDPAVQPLKNYIIPYTTKQIGNVKVGIFGLTTPATNMLSQPAPAVLDENFVQTAAAMVETLMTNGCNVVVCLSHLGLGYDMAVAENVPGIHVIVGGHDHFKLDQPQAVRNPAGETTWIVQANAFYLDLGKLRLTVSDGHVQFLDYALIPIDSTISEEPATAAVVSGLIADIESVYGPVFSAKIADVTSDFEEIVNKPMQYGSHDTPIGNLVADAFRQATGTQIAMEVGGSTAQPLYHGPIVAADVFRVVGYGFNLINGLGYRLATFEMTGAALLAGLEFGASNIEQDDEFLVQVSGMEYVYNSDLAAGSRNVAAKVAGVDLDPSATYTVTANEFVPMFLDLFQIPYANAHICGDTTEFSALAGFVQQLGTLTPVVEGRVRNIGVGSAVSPEEGEVIPRSYRLDQNFPNPFNPSTTISFALPQKERVRLEIYDILGNLVNTLLDQEMSAGSHEVVWNGVDKTGVAVATGMYLYRLQAGLPAGQAGSFSAVKKMLLLK